MRNFFKVWVALAIVFCQSVVTSAAGSEAIKYPKNLWKGIIGEAVSEGYDGMYAVTCVYRNRLGKGIPLGCVALKRKDIDKFVEKQGKKYQKMAQRIIIAVFKENGPDITKGATHYENVEKFGMPSWAKNMEITIKIGHHTFFKEKVG